MNTTQKGNRGEELAIRWLRSQGFTPLVTNWRSGKFEIDIIAQTEAHLVFVEVKLRDLHTLTRPLQAVTKGKKARIMAAATRFLEDHPTPLEPRFDLLEIWDTKPEPQIQHWPDLFQP